MTTPTSTLQPDLGIDANAQEGAIYILSTLLADEFTLRLKLRKYHWNVTGPQFRSLHELFEEQYTALAVTIDEIAERLRSYGGIAPGTMSEFTDLKRLPEHPHVNPDVETMVKNLVADHESMIRVLRDEINMAGEDYGDAGLEDFLTAQLQEHQEMAWMLRSFVGDNRS